MHYRTSLACCHDHAGLLCFAWLQCAPHHCCTRVEISGGTCWITVPWPRWIVCFAWSLSLEAAPSCEAAPKTEVKPPLSAVTLRNSSRERPLRGRPRSLIDYKSYTDTEQLVARILEQSSCSMSPDIHELVENIKSVLKSDEKHMAEAIISATFLEQVVLSLVVNKWCGNLLAFICEYRFMLATLLYEPN